MDFELLSDKLPSFRKYPRLRRTLATVKTKSETYIGDFKIRKDIDYLPQPGLQESICQSTCNLIFMCGQGTAGKTYALYLKALGGIDKYGFTARLISVRAMDSKKGTSMFRDGESVCGKFAGCESASSETPTFYWPRYNSNLQLIHSNFNADNPAEWEMFQDYAKKQQASLIMIDEATEMKQFKMFTFWFMRNRDSSGMKPQMVLTFNPLHTHWTTQMLRDAGFLTDDGYYLRPEMIGKKKWFYVKGDTPAEIIWGDTAEDVVERAGLVLKPEDAEAGLTATSYVKSFTVFTGTAADNRELVHATGGQSVANLHAVGGTQRAVVGEAYFGPIDNTALNVNRDMIHSLWSNPISNDNTMYATLDVSGGGAESDNCPMGIFRGNQLVAIRMFKGDNKMLVDWIHANLREFKVPITNFAFDATGIGYYLKSFTSGNAIMANARPIQEYDSAGNAVKMDSFFNLRSQLLSKLEVMLQKGELSFAVSKDLMIPYGKKGETRRVVDILFDEMDVFRFTESNGKRYAVSKNEYKARHKHSPDMMDMLMLFMVFFLDSKPKKAEPAKCNPNAYKKLYHRPPAFNIRRFR